VSAMAIGAGIGAFGGALPFVEGVIALSVLVLGLLVAFRIHGALPWTLPLIALFALFHGYAHAIEVPEFASASSYFAGVLMATASLHAFGVAAAVFLHQEAKLLRVGGLAISVAGAWLMLGA
jgi:urease accessory protein